MGNDNSVKIEQIGLIKEPLQQLRAWQRFHIRLTGLYGGAVFLSLVLIAGVFYNLSVDAEIANLQQRLLSITTSIAASVNADRLAAVPLDSGDTTEYHAVLHTRFASIAEQDPDVQSIYLLRPTGERTKLRFFIDFVKNGKTAVPGEEYDASEVPVMLRGLDGPAAEDEPVQDEFGVTLSGYAPVRDAKGVTVGLVGADVQAARIQTLKENVLWVTLGVFGVAALLLGVISFAVARSVREPLTRIINATAAISHGHLTTRLSLQRRDEFGLMSRYFDKMAEGLEEREFIRATFGRYVSEDVARQTLERREQPQLGGEERHVTVLFSDLAGYSTICEQLAPAQVVEMLNQYLGAMNVLIDEHHGCVIEFLGDAILAVFGAPYHREDHAEQAVRCALAMNERLKALNEEWQRTGLAHCWTDRGIAQLNARVGIHSGRVIAGNLGGATRMKYAIIGDAVNVAARLEGLNKELSTHTLVSGEVYAALPVDLIARTEFRGAHPVKGRVSAVQVYALN